MLVSDDSIISEKHLDAVDFMARRVSLKINRIDDGRKLGVSNRSTRFYWYNKSSQSLKLFRILAAK
jgi:hypothetical protein